MASSINSELAQSADLSKVNGGDAPLHRAVRAACGEHEPSFDVDGDNASLAACLDAALALFSAAALAAAFRLHNLKDGQNPLHLAAARGSFPVCEVLLQHGAPIDSYTLRRAALPRFYGCTHNCGYWVVRGRAGQLEPLNKATDQTCLHLAIDYLAEEQSETQRVDDTALVRLLIDRGADVGALDSRRRTPLEKAVCGGLHAVAELLAEAAGRGTWQSGSALHLAIGRRDGRMVEMLLRLGARTDLLGSHGWTPLGLAARSGAADVTKALLVARADVHATSANGKTALEIATINRGKPSSRPVLEAIQTEVAASVLEIAFRRQPRDPFAAVRGAPLQAVPHLPRLAPAPGPLLPPVAALPPSPLCASKRRPSGGSSLLVPPVARAGTSRPILEGMEGSAAGN